MDAGERCGGMQRLRWVVEAGKVKAPGFLGCCQGCIGKETRVRIRPALETFEYSAELRGSALRL